MPHIPSLVQHLTAGREPPNPRFSPGSEVCLATSKKLAPKSPNSRSGERLCKSLGNHRKTSSLKWSHGLKNGQNPD